MKTTYLRMLCLILSALLLFGCSPQGGKPSGSADTTPSDASKPTEASNPTAPSGSIPAAPLTFDLQTAKETSRGRLWETETGFYYSDFDHLHYADKSDLSNWVIVCNKPDCKHDRDTCPASIGGSGFYLKDGRIYGILSTILLTPNANYRDAIYSVPADGSDDFRLEYPLERMLSSQGGSMRVIWEPEAFYLEYDSIDQSGMYQNTLSRITENGEQILCTLQTQDQMWPNSSCHEIGSANGDMIISTAMPDGIMDENGWGKTYRVTEDGLEEFPNISKTPDDTWRGLFRGDNLYYPVPNDGYYYKNLQTGQSVKWMDSQLKDSWARIYGTNFIVESTMRLIRYDPEPEGDPQMRIYNGTEWKDVALPDSIWREDFLSCPGWAVTSTYFFFTVTNMGDGTEIIYMVDLTQDKLEAVQCAEIS